MLKKINRVLGLLGLKLIRPRRYAPKSEAQRVKEFVEEFNGPKVPLSDYMGECEWQNIPPGGHDGDVGPAGIPGPDDIALGRRREEFAEHRSGTENVAFGYATKARVVNPEPEWQHIPDNPGGNEGRTHYVGDGCVPPHPEFETPRVEQPNSDNKTTGPTS